MKMNPIRWTTAEWAGDEEIDVREIAQAVLMDWEEWLNTTEATPILCIAAAQGNDGTAEITLLANGGLGIEALRRLVRLSLVAVNAHENPGEGRGPDDGVETR